MKSYSRVKRINELIKEEISFIIHNRLKDPRIGFLTVIDVEVSNDLSLARIFFTIYGDEKTKTEAMQGLNSASGFIRRELAARIRLRTIPELRFIIDETYEKSSRIDSLLKEVM